MTSKEIRKELRAVRQEMRERGIKTVSCFNGGLDDGTYRANAMLYRLKINLEQALKAEQPTRLKGITPCSN
jgi:hypothetical protein